MVIGTEWFVPTVSGSTDMQVPLTRMPIKQQGTVSIEAALILPVLLFILVMFFELSRTGFVIWVVNSSFESAVQKIHEQGNYNSMDQLALGSLIEQQVVDHSYSFISADNVKVDVHTFSHLGIYTGEVSGNSPVIALTLTLTQRFITPLPELFDLGSLYQHEFQQVLGDLIADEN